MAKSPRVFPLSKVLEFNDIGLRYTEDSMIVTLAKSTPKKSRDLVYTLSETSPMELVRFGSNMLHGRVVYDFDDTTQDEASWLLQKRFDDVVREKPSDSNIEPGMAYLFKGPQRYDAKENEYHTVFPPVGPDGSYAYMVRVKDLHVPHQWKQEMLDQGFQVHVSSDAKKFYGSRFPGGDKGVNPAPMSLSPLLLRVPDVSALPANRPAKGASPKKAPGKTEKQDPKPAAGGKVWCQIPPFRDCVPLMSAFSNRAEPLKAASLIRNPPKAVKAHLPYRDTKHCQSALAALKRFVEDWKPNGKLVKPNMSIFMRKLMGLCQSEASYCSLFCMLNSSFKFDWDKDTVSTVDQHREESEALRAQAAESEEEETEEGSADDDSDEESEGSETATESEAEQEEEKEEQEQGEEA